MNKDDDGIKSKRRRVIAGSRRDSPTRMTKKNSSSFSKMLGLAIVAGMASPSPVLNMRLHAHDRMSMYPMENSRIRHPEIEDRMNKSCGCFDIGSKNFALLTSKSMCRSKWATTRDTRETDSDSLSSSEEEVQ